MKRILPIALWSCLFSLHSYAQELSEIEIPLGTICQQELEERKQEKNPMECPDPVKLPQPANQLTLDLKNILTEKKPTSFENCEKIQTFGKVLGDKPVSIQVMDQNHKKWKLKFYFGNNKTWYGTTTAKIKSSRLDLTIKDLQPYERRSDSFFKFWNYPLLDAFRWIDEPTNTFKFTLENNKNEISLSIFHPKFVFVEGDQEFTGHHYNENAYVKGTADGYAVDGRMKLKGDFGPNPYQAFIPGNVYFVSWENSHKLLQPEIGLGHKFDLIKSKGSPIVTYTPSVSAGIFLGIQNNSYSTYDKRWEFDSHEDEKMRVMGGTVSVGNKIVIHDRQDRAGVFVEHKLTYGKMKYAFLDGQVEHEMKMSTLNVGVQMTLKSFKKKIKDPDEKITD